MLEQRSENPRLSHPTVVDLTADSSGEGSSGSNHLQMVRETTPVKKRSKLHNDSPPVTIANTTNYSAQPLNTDSAIFSPPTASAAQITSSGTADPRIELLYPDGVSSEDLSNPQKTRSQNRNLHILRYLFMLSQWWMIQRRSGPLYAVRNLPNSLVIPFVTLSN